MRYLSFVAVALSLVLLPANHTFAQDMSGVEIGTVQVADGVYMLTGQGGNIGLSVGEDGAFLIDDQFAPLTDKIAAAVAKLTDKPVEFVVNTHFHADHVGGNESFGKSGSIIIAHENVRKRLTTKQIIAAFGMEMQPAPAAALPVVTFPDRISLHYNGDVINVFHVKHAHTDGDAIIHFKNSNVIHAGDIVFNKFYPFIDADNGGNIHGVIHAVNSILKLCNDDTKIIPGHGGVASRADLVAYREMLMVIYARIRSMLERGMSVEQIVAATPSADYDGEFGQGIFKPAQWVELVAKGMSDHMSGHMSDHGME